MFWEKDFWVTKTYIIFAVIKPKKDNSMNTISINTQLYNFAESYALENNISVSQLIENFLSGLLKKSEKKSKKKTKKGYVMKEVSELSPIVRQLAGIAKSEDNDSEDLNGIDAKTEFLTEKYEL